MIGVSLLGWVGIWAGVSFLLVVFGVVLPREVYLWHRARRPHAVETLDFTRKRLGS